MMRAALAGAAAAATWAALEPLGGRFLGTPPRYSDVRLLGALLSRERWRPLGLALHLLNGAAFGIAFRALGGHGWRRGLLAAQLENLALWPGMAAVDRLHPDRRSGAWPPLLGNGRVFAHEVVVHAVFGVTLGLLAGRNGRNADDDLSPR